MNSYIGQFYVRFLLCLVALGGLIAWIVADSAIANAEPSDDFAEAGQAVCQVLTHNNVNAELDSVARTLLAKGYTLQTIGVAFEALIEGNCPSLMPVYNVWTHTPWTQPSTASSTTGTIA